MTNNRTYISIDLKSFYASAECIERGLDPMTTNLVVADASRSEKTICLAVSPSLKAYGIPGRPRLFEVVHKVKEINAQRLRQAPKHTFTGSSFHDPEVKTSPELSLDYITAIPQMAKYIKYSTQIYDVYLKYIAPEDIHVYSIDEVFIDATNYLRTYKLSARELAIRMILDVLNETGVTATAGIGTNLYLAKVAMDIGAKHIQEDENGVRIAELDEMSYRRSLWDHRPLIDFWRVGRGYSKKLEENGIYTMGDIARCSVGSPNDHYNEALLYKLFGINAELLIDHAWGWEPCTMADIKAYKPANNSIGSGQVLMRPYSFDKAKLVVREMVDALILDLLDKGLVTDQIVLTVGYDIENLNDPDRRGNYHGEVTTDYYGRTIPKHAHGTANLGRHTSSARIALKAVSELYDHIVDNNLLVRRLNISANHVIAESSAPMSSAPEQIDFFTDYEAVQAEKAKEDEELAREKKMQEAILTVQKKFGKNVILKGSSFEEGATAKDRNGQIGGHKK